jgi:iodotyrosine deiodinase
MTTPLPKTRLAFERRAEPEMIASSRAFVETMRRRRSVRDFCADPIPIEVVERSIEAAALAPSGANKQPWTFALVTAPEMKRKIREAAEKEEEAFYGWRAARKWVEDVERFGTGPEKPFLETAPALIVVFGQRHGQEQSDRHYYVNESVGIAVGILLAGLQHAGIATLTHTPAPMEFLRELLGRPSYEKAFCIIVAGFPTPDCVVPYIT